MYVVTRMDSIFSCPTLATFETAEDALAFLAQIGVTFMEEDAQNPGCWDGMGRDGRVHSIEKK
jgi:hypothetical protein